MKNGKTGFRVTNENCFYGLRPENYGEPEEVGYCPCAIVEGENGYNVCLIHEFRSFYPIHASFGKFTEAVAFARGEFGQLRFQRVSLDDFAATPPGFLESLFHSPETVNLLRGNAS